MITDKPRFPIKETILYGFWPNFIKKIIFRLKGYKIGKGVVLNFGSVVSGKQVEIGDYTAIGYFTSIRCETINIGRHVKIGAACIIDTPHFSIGDGSKLNEQVFVGGLQFPDSSLSIGKNCQIMQMTFLNPTCGIKIGDDSGIGGDSLVFGHFSWLSVFDGYPADFRPIEIGRSVSIAWRVFVGAGAKIGDGAVIGANSLVNRSIPSSCLATGSPAKVVSKAPYFPREISVQEKQKYLIKILDELKDFLSGYGNESQHYQDLKTIETRVVKKTLLNSKKILYKLKYEIDDSPIKEPENCNVFVSLSSISESLRSKLESKGIMWIDIEKKERSELGNDMGEEAIQYLRRYGVRFTRNSGKL